MKFLIKSQAAIFFIGIYTLVSCSSTGSSGTEGKKFLSPAGGKFGETILVMDSLKWGNQLGKQVKAALREPYPGLPQAEPSLSVSYVSPKQFNSVLKTARNIVFVMTMDGNSYEDKLMRGYFSKSSLEIIDQDPKKFVFFQEDVYARGQSVVYLFNKTEKGLIEKISQNGKKLRDYLLSAERKRMIQSLNKRINKDLSNLLLDEHKFYLKIPIGFDVSKNLKNFIWVRQLEADSEMNLFVHYEPYESEEVFDNVLAHREKITSTFIRDVEKPQIYLTYQSVEHVPLEMKEVNFNGKYAMEMRSLWKLSDISAGGPFVSYTFVDEVLKRVYYIEGYYYGAGGKKRNQIWELEAILSTFKTASEKGS